MINRRFATIRLQKESDVVLEKNEEQKLIEEATNASALVINYLSLSLSLFFLSHSLSLFPIMNL